MRKISYFAIVFALFFNISAYAESTDPLPSWNEGPTKKAILNFVQTTTDKNSSQFVPENERLAAFDQDGTLWVEQPIYTQVIFAFDRINEMAPEHPEWKNQEPFKSVITKNKAGIAKFSVKDFEAIFMMTHSGMPVDNFKQTAKNWFDHAKNPKWNRPYTDLIYQPMLEAIHLLQKNGYKTYIVTGGGQEFVRVYSDGVYHIPTEQVIGTSLKTEYGYDKKNNPDLIIAPHLLHYNNEAGKPEGIYLFTSKKPQIAFGNSVGDKEMLEYTESNQGAHLMLLVHHDDAKREFAYGPNSVVGTFSDELKAEAIKRGWYIISMKNDWKRIFPFEN